MQRPSKPARIVGWILTIVPAGMLVMSAAMKFTQNEQVKKGFESWPAGTAVKLGIVELAVTVLFLADVPDATLDAAERGKHGQRAEFLRIDQGAGGFDLAKGGEDGLS